MMSNKRRVAHFFHSHKIVNALRESIASYPERIVRYSPIRSMPQLAVFKAVINTENTIVTQAWMLTSSDMFLDSIQLITR